MGHGLFHVKSHKKKEYQVVVRGVKRTEQLELASENLNQAKHKAKRTKLESAKQAQNIFHA